MRSPLPSPESWSPRSLRVSPATFPRSSAISPCGKCSNPADLQPIAKLRPFSAWVAPRASPCPPLTLSLQPSPSSIAPLSSLSTKTSPVSLALQTFPCTHFPDFSQLTLLWRRKRFLRKVETVGHSIGLCDALIYRR